LLCSRKTNADLREGIKNWQRRSNVSVKWPLNQKVGISNWEKTFESILVRLPPVNKGNAMRVDKRGST